MDLHNPNPKSFLVGPPKTTIKQQQPQLQVVMVPVKLVALSMSNNVPLSTNNNVTQ